MISDALHRTLTTVFMFSACTGALWLTWVLTPLRPWTWKKVLIRTVMFTSCTLIYGSYLISQVKPQPIMAGTPHPHDGVTGKRPWMYEHENPILTKRNELLARIEHHAEFAQTMLTDREYLTEFEKFGVVLSNDEIVLIADPFFNGFLEVWFHTLSPVQPKDLDAYNSTHSQGMQSVVHEMLEECSSTGCGPYFRTYKHDNDGDGEVVGFGYPVGDGEDPNLYYMVTNMVFPIAIGGGNIRFIMIDIAWTDHILKKNDEKSSELLRSLNHVFRYDVPWHNKAWWANPVFTNDEFDWEFDEKEFDPKSPLTRDLQILRSILGTAMYQMIGIRFAEIVAIRNSPETEAPKFELTVGLMRVISPKHVVT